MARKKKTKKPKVVETLTHKDDKRPNIPTAEYQALLRDEEKTPIQVAFERRNPDLDPQLVWRGKDLLHWSDLVVQAPPLYIQEKVHPKVLIDDLKRLTQESAKQDEPQLDLFADFNGLPSPEARTEFYQHEANWANRMILGDSLHVMASLAEREGLRGKVQCIYFDPPYGIKFNSNFQWSTTSRDVKDGKAEHITREPEQVKAFRDTWRDGIHSYLTYLRDRLTVARDLLTDSGSIFVQIGDENVHRVRAVMDEVFGEENYSGQIVFRKTSGKGSGLLDVTTDTLLWYAKKRSTIKFRAIFEPRVWRTEVNIRWVQLANGVRRPLTKDELLGSKEPPASSRVYRPNPLTSARSRGASDVEEFEYHGKVYTPGHRTFSTNITGLMRLKLANRLLPVGRGLNFIRFFDDFPLKASSDIWEDTRTGGFGDEKLYVVQTVRRVVERCLLMTTDPGDLVLDPTCGSGTTAYVAEQWGRRWITIDTSRVALALARARIMGARYPYYLLADSREGQLKEAEITGKPPSEQPTYGNIKHGFVYERVPHITLKSIANNAEIDVIWERYEEQLLPLREQLTAELPAGWLADYRSKQNYDVEVPDAIQEWEVPRECPDDWSPAARELHARFWELRIARQKEIDASIAAKADYEYLYDKPYQDKNRVRVAGPFTVESLSPHRTLGVDENDELIDPAAAETNQEYHDFASIILEHLRTAGVQQAHKEDKIEFLSLTGWPGKYICAEGTYMQGDQQRRAGIFIGPEFGTVSRVDLVAAAREAADAGFDVLIACAFNYEAHASEFDQLGKVPVLKARMNADLHMAQDLKNTGKGNLFVIFGEPDIDIIECDDGRIRVQVNGVDVFHPQSGEVRSDGPDGIACWFIDTDYNEESFFVRQAYFLGMNDPYKALKTTLKAEIDREAWETLHSNISRPFNRPTSGRIAVKVINHLGDEVMKVFRV
ncbi:MAG: site-specific DNA-methyltransferase [Candidatus Zixiibacteriota bacterium]|nr:MAG: site-specific DNA-methyltransferase [candidate division Zixibacteria bacterium]